MVFVALCFFVTILSIIKYIVHVKHIDSLLKDVKSLPRIPLVGNLALFMGKSLQEVYEEFIRIILKEGTPFKAQIGPAFFVILDKPDDMKTVLMSQHCLDRPYIYDFIHRPFSILGQKSGHVWKPVRKLMNPMFNLKTLQSFLPILNSEASLFVQKLKHQVNQPQFDILHYSGICTLGSVSGTIMGIDSDAQSNNEGLEFLSSLENIYDCITKRVAQPFSHLEYIYQWTNLYKKEQQNWAILRKFTNRVFDKRFKEHLTANNNDEFDGSDNSYKKTEFPLISLCADGKINEELVKQNIDILFIGGHETTASTIAYAILMLAMHPNIQDQVYDELHSMYDTQDQETTYELMPKFEILNRVIKETLRLFPSVYFFSRTSAVDVPLSSCIIPKGSTIGLPIYTMHRRRDIWGQDAESFNPDHFLPENVQKRHPFAYLPFSSGQRNCIGNQYAMVTTKVMLSAILRQYEFSTELTMSDLRPKFEVTLRLSNKHMVKVKQRVWST